MADFVVHESGGLDGGGDGENFAFQTLQSGLYDVHVCDVRHGEVWNKERKKEILNKRFQLNSRCGAFTLQSKQFFSP